MNFEVISISFALGLGASLGCVGACMPVFAPAVIAESTNLKSGMWFSLVFSLARLVVYSVLGFICFQIGVTYIVNNPMLERYINLLLAVVLVTYGVSLILKTGRKNQCFHRGDSKTMAIILGTLVGTISCPALWLAIMLGVKTSQITNVILSVTTFWLTSSFLMVLLGVFAVKVANYYRLKKDHFRVNVVCGLMLAVSGLIYFFRGW